ncbi:DUF3141 domain-containing protein [Microvirga sp. P5_D2]
MSTKAANLEHRAILENLPRIETLEPGLDETRIAGPVTDTGLAEVTFEERRVEDLRFDYPQASFERVWAISEANERAYRTIVSPWVQALATPWSAAALEWMHPMRARRYVFSTSASPWMKAVEVLAPFVGERHRPRGRQPVQDRRGGVVRRRHAPDRGRTKDSECLRGAHLEVLYGGTGVAPASTDTHPDRGA